MMCSVDLFSSKRSSMNRLIYMFEVLGTTTPQHQSFSYGNGNIVYIFNCFTSIFPRFPNNFRSFGCNLVNFT